MVIGYGLLVAGMGYPVKIRLYLPDYQSFRTTQNPLRNDLTVSWPQK
jgi:hypothetical protein